MVHILSEVLEKCHRSLKLGGLLYSSQPGEQKTRVAVQRDGEIVFFLDLKESYFRHFLDLCHDALWQAVDAGLFVVEAEVTWPSQTNFQSINTWLGDRLNDSEDDGEMRSVASTLRTRCPDGIDLLAQHRQNWGLLLKKV